MTSREPVVILVKKGNVACVTINRPEKRNALNQDVRDGFAGVFEEINKDDAIKVVTTTGAGDVAYSAGMDLNDLLDRFTHPDDPDPPSLSELVRDCPKITIAVVNGYCLGAGFSLMACHDLAIASKEKAQFGLPEIMRDFIPRGAAARICQGTNRKWAMEMLVTGKNWDAKRAYKGGLVNRIVPHAELQAAAFQWAKEIAQWNARTLMNIKKAVHAIYEAPTYRAQMEAGERLHEEDNRDNPGWGGLRDFLGGKGIKANQ
ncbi:MAG: enoyl-CoA hydratase/isomerase family protein [Chloroflexi bacterium]|nr:enoyl-CoA hydratase/isomerase family protein [Chloroflexota bacterium]